MIADFNTNCKNKTEIELRDAVDTADADAYASALLSTGSSDQNCQITGEHCVLMSRVAAMNCSIHSDSLTSTLI